MDSPHPAESLTQQTASKICLIVLEGMGGIPMHGRTALEAADCPCLDRLASESDCGLLEPARPGLTPTRESALLALLGGEPAAEAPGFGERYRLRPLVLTRDDGMARLAQRLGIPRNRPNAKLASYCSALGESFASHDFFLIHMTIPMKGDGEARFASKVKAVENCDRHMSSALALEPDVLALTGAYSAPAALGGPSWHPTPILIWSRYTRNQRVTRFTEYDCGLGSLGKLSARDALPLLLAHAGKLRPWEE